MQGHRLVLEKWMQYRVAGREPDPKIVDDFERVLGDASDERPLQTFFTSFPIALAPLAPVGGTVWCLDRPKLGSEFVPDFLIASNTSVGFRWAMVELESPVERALTKGGLPAKKLAEAFKQIRDWRTWLTDNVAYARSELGLKDIEAGCPAYVVVGRRSSLDPNQIKTYRALSSGDVTVMSYDRLLEQMAQAARKSTSEECNRSIVNASVQQLHAVRALGSPRQLIAVACSIRHASQIAALYRELGLRVEVLHSRLKEDERTRIEATLRSGVSTTTCQATCERWSIAFAMN